MPSERLVVLEVIALLCALLLSNSNHCLCRRDFYIFKVAATEELQLFMQRYGFDTYALAVMYLYQPDSIIGERLDGDAKV